MLLEGQQRQRCVVLRRDVEAEDAVTEGNFVKLYKLSQLMVEYLLYVQDTLVEHKVITTTLLP